MIASEVLVSCVVPFWEFIKDFGYDLEGPGLKPSPIEPEPVGELKFFGVLSMFGGTIDSRDPDSDLDWKYPAEPSVSSPEPPDLMPTVSPCCHPVHAHTIPPAMMSRSAKAPDITSHPSA